MFASAEVEASPTLARLRISLGLPDGVATDLDSVVRFTIASSETLAESAQCLLLLLSGGYSVWEDGHLYEVRALVAALGGLKIIIHTREHGPAHFHVVAPGIDASFAIDGCRLLEGELSGRERRLIEYWHSSARSTLVKIWNSTRPSDCPVGPINQ